MQTSIVTGGAFDLTLCGAEKMHEASQSYGEEIVALLDRVWPVLRTTGARQNGINVAVYDADGTVFAGVELLEPDAGLLPGLAIRRVHFDRHVSFTHVGPYRLLGEAHQRVRDEIARQGWTVAPPVVEVYGHWSDDESKLQTRIVCGIEER